jgi:hypothetical protein
VKVLSSASLSVGRQPGRVGIGASPQHHVTNCPAIASLISLPKIYKYTTQDRN